MAAMSRIDYDAADLQAQGAGQRVLAVASQFGSRRRAHFLGLIVRRFFRAAALFHR